MQEQMECTCGADVNGYAHTKSSGHATTCPKHAQWLILVNNRKSFTAKTKRAAG